MRKFKRMIALITVALFVLSFAAPAMAATQDDATQRLNGLSIVQGYPDGTFGLDKNITRAEFAVVAVKLLGLSDAIEGAKGATKFNDVAASHWATGAINLAVGNGVIKGYPDGTFKPEANVTLAEATAMLVQVLGYGPALTGTWPNNVMGKGAEIGLLKGVSVANFNAAATRGTVFTSADNALDIKVMKQIAFGTEQKWEISTKTLIEDKLDYVKVKDASITATPLTNTGLAAGKVTIDAPGTTYDGNYKVIGSFDYNDLIGLKGTAWLNETDDEVLYFQSTETVVIDTIKDNPTATTIKLKDLDKTYNTVSDTVYYVNFKSGKNHTDLAAGMPVKVVFDTANSDNIAKVFGFNWNVTGIVDRVDVSNKKIYLKVGGSSVTLVDKYIVVKDGKYVGLGDVKAGDVVQYNSTDKNYVLVSDKTATGKLTDVLTSTVFGARSSVKFNIGGATYNTPSFYDAKVSTDDGKNYSTTVTGLSNLNDVVNKDVTAYLDAYGKVAFIKSGSANVSSDITVLVKEFTEATGADGTNAYVRVMKADGVETYFKVNKDTKINSDAAKPDYILEEGASLKYFAAISSMVKRGAIVKLELNSTGDTVSKFKTYTDIEGPAVATLDETNDILTINSRVLQVQSDSVFFTVKTNDTAQVNGAVYGIKDAKKLTLGDVESTYANFDGNDVTVVFDGAKVKYVFIDDTPNVTSDTKVGMLISQGTDGTDPIYNVLLKGDTTVTTFTYGSYNAIANKILVTLKADSDNEMSQFTAATAESPTGVYTRYYVKDVVDGANDTKILTLTAWNDTTETFVDENVEETVFVKAGYTIYYNVDSTPVAVDGVGIGDHVTVYDILDKDGKYNGTGNDIIDFVVIKD